MYQAVTLQVLVDARANTGPVDRKTPVLFEPDELAQWPECLVVRDSVTTVKQSTTTRTKLKSPIPLSMTSS